MSHSPLRLPPPRIDLKGHPTLPLTPPTLYAQQIRPGLNGGTGQPWAPVRFARALLTRPPFPPHRVRVAGRDGVEQRRAVRRGWEVFEREGTGKVIKGRGETRKGRENWLAV